MLTSLSVANNVLNDNKNLDQHGTYTIPPKKMLQLSCKFGGSSSVIMLMSYSCTWGEWVNKFIGPIRTEDIGVHINCVIITYTLDSLSPLT